MSKKSETVKYEDKAEDKPSEKSGLSGKFEKINKDFDAFTKRISLGRILLVPILYFLFYLIFESIFGFCKNFVSTGLADPMSFFKISVTASIMFAMLLWIMPKKVQLVLFPISAAAWLVYSAAQLCVVKSNGSMFRVSNVLTGKNAAEFAGSVIRSMPWWIWLLLALLLAAAVVIEILLIKKGKFTAEKPFGKVKLISGGAAFLLTFLLVLTYSPAADTSFAMYVYENFTDTERVYSLSDLYTYSVHDISTMIMARTSAKKNSEKIDSFFEARSQHAENDMTGIFKDKNLLVIQLESFEKRLVTDELCPNIKKVMSESIVFGNYYGMRFGAEPTIGNEIAVNTGFYATSDYTASSDLVGSYFPYSLANSFTNDGYSANVYHENLANFYDRDKSELAFGYKKYNSFHDMTDKDIVFEDDYVIADCDDLYEPITGGSRYMNYVIGFSTHPPYVLDNERWESIERYNEALKRHPELKKYDTSSQDDVYKVFATMTDDMVGRLLERMEEDGRLDDTVILFVADHANVNSLSENTGADYMRVQNLPCFIYAKGIQPQTVDKVCSNIDLLPTIINMFGIDNGGSYIGNDIFDESSEGLAYLPSFDWVTDKCMYVGGVVAENYTDEEITDEYIDKINAEVQERIEVNNLVLYSEYYKSK